MAGPPAPRVSLRPAAPDPARPRPRRAFRDNPLQVLLGTFALYSNITIRSFNWATIGNCDDGVFFDDTTTNNIVIEGVELVCLNGHSVYAPFLGQHHNVILRNNYLESGLAPAINILQGDYWTITGNQILSLGTGIYLNATGGTIIHKNMISVPTLGSNCTTPVMQTR